MELDEYDDASCGDSLDDDASELRGNSSASEEEDVARELASPSITLEELDAVTDASSLEEAA